MDFEGNADRREDKWTFFKTDTTKQAVIYFTQIIIIYIVIISCIINIAIGKGDNKLWTTLLSSCLGYLLPSPTLKPKEGNKRKGQETRAQ